MKNSLVGAFVGVGAVLLAATLYFAVRRGVKEATRAATEAADKVADQVGAAAKEGLKEGIRGGVDAAGQKAKKLPAEIFGDILDTVRGKGGRADGDSTPTDSSKPFKPQDVVQDVFNFGRQVAKQADDVVQGAVGLTVDEERNIGRKFHELMTAKNAVLKSPEEHDRVQRVAGPIIEKVGRHDISYTFTILDVPEINACSIPGGYIYVNKGLLKFVANDAELQFVLGHEIGHVDLKHCVRNMTYAVQAAKIAGQPAELAVQLIYRQYQLAFSKELEYEADAYAFQRLIQIGRTREEALSFTEHFIEHQKAEGDAGSDPKPETVPDALKQEVWNHFRTHPASADRLERLRGMKDETKKGGD